MVKDEVILGRADRVNDGRTSRTMWTGSGRVAPARRVEEGSQEGSALFSPPADADSRPGWPQRAS
eukprot:2954718-Prymnesium_polylepis.1